MVLITKNSVSFFYSDSVLANFPIYSNLFVTPKSILCFGGHLWTWQRSKKIEFPEARVTSWGQTRWCSAFLFQPQKCALFAVKFGVMGFSHLYAFCWWFSCLKCLLIIMLKYYLAFLQARRTWCVLWRK